MVFYTMLFFVCILGALMGVRKPWCGGFAGLLMVPFLFIFNMSFSVISFIISAFVLFLFSVVYGYLSFMTMSGLKGGGHTIGQTYISGFGAHHPGGIILSDEELKILAHKDIKHVGILSY